MSEKPLERLNFFNGQRLNAGDFLLEQQYHMRVRRWLNRSLYTPGIAMGLEVYAVPGAPRVRVNPGLALDPLGREIILLESREIAVMHDIGQTSRFDGSYLVIRYDEELLAQQDACCLPAGSNDNKAAQGGPSRVLADPVIECVPDLPHEASGKIVLGRVVLAAGCGSIERIDTSYRRYTGRASDAHVRQYALEGEREVAAVTSRNANAATIDVGARIYFHIRDRQPSSLVLILRASQLSPLYYTELGRHSHGADIHGAIGDHTLSAQDTNHSHPLTDNQGTALVSEIEKEDDIFNDGVKDFGPHQHYLFGRAAYAPIPSAGTHTGFNLIHTDAGQQVIDNDVDLEVRWGRHKHRLVGPTADSGFSHTLTHAFNSAGSSIGEMGVEDHQGGALIARVGEVMTYVRDLQIKIDGVNQTEAIKRQVLNNDSASTPADWAMLGNGKDTHAFVTRGSGPIRLDFLPDMIFGEGEHVIEFSVAGSVDSAGQLIPSGGRIHYNLYVE